MILSLLLLLALLFSKNVYGRGVEYLCVENFSIEYLDNSIMRSRTSSTNRWGAVY
jgi:hypothetical protein